MNRLARGETKDEVMKIPGVLNVWFEDRDFGFIHVEKADVILSHFLHRANIKSGTPKTGAARSTTRASRTSRSTRHAPGWHHAVTPQQTPYE